MAIVVQKENCIGCGACISICPVGAIEFEANGKAEIGENCIACGACISECPVKCIIREQVNNRLILDLDSYKNIWVYIECEKNRPKNVAYELLGVARRLADASGEECVAIVIGGLSQKYLQDLIANGADKIYYLENNNYLEYNTEIYTQVVTDLVKEHKPNALLIGATVNGRDLAPRIAGRLKTGLCADCTAIDNSAEKAKLIEWTRPAFGGNIMATIVCPEHRPQMGSVRPKVFPVSRADYSRKGEIILIKEPNLQDNLVKILETIVDISAERVNIQDAEIICAGGRGMGNKETFEQLYTLADLLGGVVAGSRAVVESGWLEHHAQVGQSGVTVGPKVYFAFGISGAIQHLAGINACDMIIAINKDANAPIFKAADYGIVGDVHKILPILIEKIRAIKVEQE